MSKLTKFIKTPKKFFADLINKKFSKTTEKPTEKKTVVKTKTMKTKETTPAVTLDISRCNCLKNYHFILCVGETDPVGALNQLMPWVQIFEKSDIKYILLVRNIKVFEQVLKIYQWHSSIIYAKGDSDIWKVINMFPNAKYVFYPSSTGNNIHLVKYNHLQHIFLGHGDSDKQSSAHKALRLFDEIWCAGQAHIDRFKNAAFDTTHLTFKKIGRPNLAKIISNSQVNWRERVNGVNILYLPTWEGPVENMNYTSAKLVYQILSEVNSQLNVNIAVKFHPFTGKRDNNFTAILTFN